jgi:hypothetical protein
MKWTGQIEKTDEINPGGEEGEKGNIDVMKIHCVVSSAVLAEDGMKNVSNVSEVPANAKKG